jgi:hypothetical protein
MKNNKDITLKDIDLKDHIIKTTIHRTDTVSVIVACSTNPIPIDMIGLAKLTSGLTRVEERVQRVLDAYYATSAGFNGNDTNNNKLHLHTNKYSIPSHMTWLVTMWHFGQDSLTGYSGEKFEIPWKEGLQLFRVYSKEIPNRKMMKIRKETQEYPNKSLEDAFMDKISSSAADEKS